MSETASPSPCAIPRPGTHPGSRAWVWCKAMLFAGHTLAVEVVCEKSREQGSNTLLSRPGARLPFGRTEERRRSLEARDARTPLHGDQGRPRVCGRLARSASGE